MSRHSSRGGAWEKLRARILERDGGICQFCHKGPLVGDDATVDHWIAKDAGGTDDPSNLVTACRSCNSRKGNRPITRTPWLNPRWMSRPTDTLIH